MTINGIQSAGRSGTTNFTVYISPYMVVSNGGNYTKHIYMGGQRITSKVSNSGIFTASPVTTIDLQAKYTAQTAKIKERFDSLRVTFKGTPQSGGLVSKDTSTPTGSYFYHSDHLGSSSLITDQSGAIVQHLEYVPFGETFIDERRSQSSWTTPYLFSGKERDEETGLLYFGARYQDSKYGIWYSVDPLAEKFAGRSSYEFCLSNPVRFIDINGMDPTAKEAKAIASHVYGDKKDDILVGGWNLKERYDDAESGLKSGLYQRPLKDGGNEYCYATAGTEKGDHKDYKNNLQQINGNAAQYQKSVDKAIQYSKDPTIGKHLSFTGHSLGGGLAAANAYATGRSAQIFNPARLSISTFTGLNLRYQNSKIDSYIEISDPLNFVQSLLPNDVIMHSMPNETKHFEWHGFSTIVSGHSIDNMRGTTSVQQLKSIFYESKNSFLGK